MKKYDPKKIEKKWQKEWAKNNVYKTAEDNRKPKYYVLDMFPYPSGAGLHVGHPKGYIATDVVARMKMMQGFNVLHPMGWDAFGLPAENYAIKNNVHPADAVEKNIQIFKKQLKLLGFTYDWNREVNTTDPKYYKWTQWAFLKMFKRGLVFESYEPINWCPECKTGLANEDLEGVCCERCGTVVEKKPIRQWVIKITDYAERLLNDLEKLSEWEKSIKEMQKNWIGRSEGAKVIFSVIPTKSGINGAIHSVIPNGAEGGAEESIEIFTTRPDTLFGATYLVLAPEHPLLEKISVSISNLKEIKEYIKKTKDKTDLERTDLAKEKNGVKVEGIAAVNPVNGEKLSVFAADYVLMGYGTGAIMAVPAHDERDWEFAKKFKLPIKYVVASPSDCGDECFTGDGVNVNSDFLNGLPTAKAKEKIIAWLEEKGFGKKKVQYKIRDWVFSRQRYWGEPIPLVHCEKCGWVAVSDSELPLELPKVKNYEPTGTGESPLANIKKWVNTKCVQCGGSAKRETNTMPQWVGSCWYYLRYEDVNNNKALVDKRKEKYWSPVDLYVGGAEHATRHLIYARFWHKFLFDIGAVNYDEPFTKLRHVGLVLAKDGRKMSKRWNNVINPDDIVAEFGADSIRLYEMFMGPFEQPCVWNTRGVVGMRRFLEKVWNLSQTIAGDSLWRFKETDKDIRRELEKTVKKITEDINNLRFNTAIAQLMIFFNKMADKTVISKNDFEKFIKLLSPFAPHLAEDIWQKLGNKESIFKSQWPKFVPALTKDEIITLVVQINGKLRDTLEVAANITETKAKQAVQDSAKIKKWLEGKTVKKVIYIHGRLVNIVI